MTIQKHANNVGMLLIFMSQQQRLADATICFIEFYSLDFEKRII